jgi:hypothetical protein
VGPKPTRIVRLVLDEMFAAVIRSIRVTTAVFSHLKLARLYRFAAALMNSPGISFGLTLLGLLTGKRFAWVRGACLVF